MANSKVLIIDAAINFLLGILLLLLIPFPEQIPRILGGAKVELTFYPSILGAVLTCIGIAVTIT